VAPVLLVVSLVLLPVLEPPPEMLLLPVLQVTLSFPLLVSNVHLIVMFVLPQMLVLLAPLNSGGTLVVLLVMLVTLSVMNVLLLPITVPPVKLLSKLLLLLLILNLLHHIFPKLLPIPFVPLVVLPPKLLVSVLLVLVVIAYLPIYVLNVMLLA
jgi:hypothetical protein